MSRKFRKPYKRYRKWKSSAVTWKALRKYLSKRTEHKYKDTLQAYMVENSSGSIKQLSNMDRGILDYERIGDTAMPSFLDIKGQIHGYDTTNCFRIVVFRWKGDSNQVYPTPNLILQPTCIGNDFAPYANYYHDGRKMFDILASKRFSLLGSTDASNYVKQFSMKIKLRYKPKAIQYTNSSAGVNHGINNIFILTISDSSTVNDPAITYVARLSYTDS